MKKIIVFILCCLLLCGCTVKALESVPAETPTPALVTETPAPIPAPTPSPVHEHFITLYAPNEDASGFIYASWELTELSGTEIFSALIEAGVLNVDVAINSLSVENGQVNIDVNKAFHTQLCTYGTAGEYMMMGSVVNTLLAAYNAQSVYVTCEGQIMETGHMIYDFPLTVYESY